MIAGVGLTLAVVAAVTLTLTAVRHDDTETPIGSTGAAIPTQGPVGVPGETSDGGPPPPRSGAWVGAVVQSADFTADGRIKAIQNWESVMGRQMDLVHTYHTWDDPFPDQVDRWAVNSGRTLLLSWGGTDTRMIQSGRYDDLIRQRAEDLKAWGKPILLQWRWEMDRPNLHTQVWGPQDYIAAWRHIRYIFARAKVSNVSWMWCPTSEGFASGRAQQFYPGDDEVDWLCADVYPGEKDQSFSARAADFLQWAKDHPKPVMIGEYGAYGGFPGGQQEWLRQAAQVAEANPSIKGLIYFNRDDVSKRPRTQLNLLDNSDAVATYRQLVAEPYFNPRSLPVTR